VDSKDKLDRTRSVSDAGYLVAPASKELMREALQTNHRQVP